MVSFESLHSLRYAWAVPLLAAGYVLSRRVTARASQEQASSGKAEALVPGRRGPLSRLRLVLRLLAFAALLLALANPRPETTGRAALAAGPTKVVFVVDVSSSMLAGDVLPDRLTQAGRVVAEAVKGLHGEEVGVVAFAGNAQLYVPLTTDYDLVARACASLSPDLVPRQGTSLAGAMALAAQVLQAPSNQPRVMCVLSDGESHTARYEGMADSLRRAGIELYAIGIGTTAGATIMVNNPDGDGSSLKRDRDGKPIRSRLQEDKLKRLVQGRPDRYIKLDTWKSATSRFLQQLHKLNAPGSRANTAGNLVYFQLCLLAAFGLLLLEFFVPPGRQI